MKSLIKYPLMLGLTTSMLFTSCHDKEKEAELQQQAEYANASKDSVADQLVVTLDEINQNLDMIRQKQGLINNSTPGENASKKQEILKNISLINALIEDNKKKVEELQEQAKKFGKEKNAMVRLANQTKERIERQEQEIASLKEQLANESFKVADLNQKMDVMQVNNEVLASEKALLAENNAQMDKDLNKVWFTYGTHDELKAKNLVEKKGGVLGIGKKDHVSDEFYKNKAAFTEVDVRETKSIPIQGKKPKMVTFHPEGSYEWAEQTDKKYATLNIKNSEEFWSASKFLIVEVR